MNINLEEVIYNKFGRCLRMYNDEVELYITLDKGPRIIRYGFIGQQNEFCENMPTTMDVEGEKWHMLGGHRLWHSPEENPRTYIPDNEKVKFIKKDNSVVFITEIEKWTQIQKEIEINLSSKGTLVEVTHRLTNKNAWKVEFSAWALTIMAKGGIEIIPQTSENTGFLPNRTISLWPYSKMNDSRIYFGEKYIGLKHDENIKSPFKIGLSNEDGWAAYINHNNMFIKRFCYDFEGKYPDFNVCYETYTNEFMVEMESLSSMTLVKPKETLQHKEKWELIKNVSLTEFDEHKIQKIVENNIYK